MMGDVPPISQSAEMANSNFDFFCSSYHCFNLILERECVLVLSLAFGMGNGYGGRT